MRPSSQRRSTRDAGKSRSRTEVVRETDRKGQHLSSISASIARMCFSFVSWLARPGSMFRAISCLARPRGCGNRDSACRRGHRILAGRCPEQASIGVRIGPSQVLRTAPSVLFAKLTSTPRGCDNSRAQLGITFPSCLICPLQTSRLASVRDLVGASSRVVHELDHQQGPSTERMCAANCCTCSIRDNLLTHVYPHARARWPPAAVDRHTLALKQREGVVHEVHLDDARHVDGLPRVGIKAASGTAGRRPAVPRWSRRGFER